MLKLSIITVNLNNAEGLRKTIDSVINQTYTHFEHIIIDGGSTDGSVEVIKEYEAIYKEKQRHLYWVSEPDKGIYNGMNKGIKMAKGEYCQFLNSGDWLIENNGLQQVFNYHTTEDLIYCDLQFSEITTITYPDKITLKHFLTGTIGHPSSFVKRKLLIELGYYNEKYLIVADWEFFIRALIIKLCSYKHLKIILTYFEQNGISTNPQYELIHKDEKINVLNNLFPRIADDYLQMKQMKKELDRYKYSRLIRFCSKLQDSKLYQKFL